MPNMTSLFRPLAPRSGVAITATGTEIGTGGVALVATATVSVCVPIPRRKCKLLSLNISVTTAAAGAGAITLQAFRRNNTGTPADVTITATSDLTATQFTTLDKSYNFAITASDTSCIFQVGDTLRLNAVAATTVTTQPQVVVTAEWAILN